MLTIFLWSGWKWRSRSIDRTDEDIHQSDDVGRYNINYRALEPCTNLTLANLYQRWIMCNNEIYYNVIYWCNERAGNFAFCSSAGVSTTDPVLCSKYTFWQNFGCDINYIVSYQGKRCTGTNQHCFYQFHFLVKYKRDWVTSKTSSVCPHVSLIDNLILLQVQ